jgi:hypothetical protein
MLPACTHLKPVPDCSSEEGKIQGRCGGDDPDRNGAGVGQDGLDGCGHLVQ